MSEDDFIIPGNSMQADKEDIIDFLKTFEGSRTLQYSILSRFLLLMLEEGEQIRKEVAEYEEKKNGE